ncbi:Hypothetical protein (Fragment), partial [Durusdinium trenchii]
EPRDATFQRLQMKFGRPSSALFQHGLLSGVVDKKLPSILQHYFGQQIGFYFAFLQHLFSYGFALSVLVAPLLAVYSVDWAKHLVQAVAQEKPLFLLDEMVSEISHLDASRSRWPLWSLMVGLTTTVWGQCVIESWHRQDIRSGDTLLTLRAERCEMASNLFIKSGEFNCPKSCFLVKSKG